MSTQSPDAPGPRRHPTPPPTLVSLAPWPVQRRLRPPWPRWLAGLGLLAGAAAIGLALVYLV